MFTAVLWYLDGRTEEFSTDQIHEDWRILKRPAMCGWLGPDDWPPPMPEYIEFRITDTCWRREIEIGRRRFHYLEHDRDDEEWWTRQSEACMLLRVAIMRDLATPRGATWPAVYFDPTII